MKLTKEEFQSFCKNLDTFCNVSTSVRGQRLTQQEFIEAMSEHDPILGKRIATWLGSGNDVREHLSGRLENRTFTADVKVGS